MSRLLLRWLINEPFRRGSCHTALCCVQCLSAIPPKILTCCSSHAYCSPNNASLPLLLRVKLLRSLVDEASSNQASIRASAVADKEASGQLRAELDRLAQENLQLQHQLTHAKDQATAAEGKLLLRQDRGSEVEAVGEGQQLIRGVHSSSTDGEQSGDAAATTANLQQRLQQADQAFEETAAALETKEREVEKLQLQLAAAAAGAGAAGAAAGAGDAAALRTAVAEVEQLKGVRDKLESMLTDFENEAADEQLRLKGELQLAEGRADKAAQQLEAAQSELVLTKQQLEAALSELLLVKQQLVEAQAQIAELAAGGRGANKQAEEAQGQLVAALKQLAQQERQLREQQAALEAAAVASAATAAAGGHAPVSRGPPPAQHSLRPVAWSAGTGGEAAACALNERKNPGWRDHTAAPPPAH